MKAKQKFLSIMIALCMMLQLFPVPVLAASAMPDADGAGLITLTEDVALSAAWQVGAGEQVTLDLAGKKITGGTIENGGTLKIQDSAGNGSVSVAGTNSIKNLEGGTLVIEGGSFSGLNAVYNAGTLQIEGGSFSGTNSVVYNAPTSKLEVSGGSFKTGGGYTFAGSTAESILLSGGTFQPGSTGLVNAASAFTLGPGVDLAWEAGTGLYEVTGAGGPAAEMEGVQYGSLYSAFSALSEGVPVTVTLLRDVSLPVALNPEKSLELDLAGKTVTLAVPTEFSRGTVKLKNGTVSAPYGDAFKVKGADVTMENLSVTASNRAAWADRGSLSVRGGNYTTTGDDNYALGANPEVLTIGDPEKETVVINTRTVTESSYVGTCNTAGISQGCRIIFDGTAYTVRNASTSIADADGNEYAGIGEALEAGKSELTLLAPVAPDEAVTIPSGRSVTLNLGRYTYGGGLINNGTLTLKAEEAGGVSGRIEGNGTLTVEGGVYTTDVSAYVGEDYVSVQDGGRYHVVFAAAEVNGVKYAGLKAALTAAADGTEGRPVTVTMLRDRIREDELSDIDGQYVVLDLNQHTFCGLGAGSSGTKTAGIQLLQKAIITIKNGVLECNDRGNNYYAVNNHGTLILEDVTITGSSVNAMVRSDGCLTMKGCTVRNGGDYAGDSEGADGSYGLLCSYYGYAGEGTMRTSITSSLIEGGYGGIHVVGDSETRKVEVAVESGAFSGGKYAVKADAGADSDPVIRISDGDFTGELAASDAGKTAIAVSGGHFTNSPGEYLADQNTMSVVPSNKPGYVFMVGDKVNSEVKPAVGAPDVDPDKIPAGAIDNALVQAAVAAAKSAQADEAALEAAANTVLRAADGKKAEAIAALTAPGSGVTVPPGQGNALHVYAQTYLDILPTAYVAEDGVQLLTLNITPMYRVVASIVDLTSPGTKLIVAGEEESGETPNAVALKGSENKLNIQTMGITVTLPDNFPTANLMVRHKAGSGTYYYQPKVEGRNVTFQVTHGFSPFTFLTDSRAATVKFGSDAEETIWKATNVGDAFIVSVSPSGQQFSGWKFDGVDGIYTTLTDDLLTALNGKGTVTAIPVFYTPPQGGGTTSPAYSVTVPAGVENGAVTVSPTSAVEGDTVTLTVEPEEGYELDGLTVTGGDGGEIELTSKGGGEYTFIMPASAVEVQVSFKPKTCSGGADCPSRHLTDVDTAQWYHEAVDYVVESGLMQGTGAAAFGPELTTTRGMAVTILYRLEHEPAVSGACPFDDVNDGSWYEDAVVWAASNQIAGGYGGDKFGPEDPVTREQMAVILYRYAQFKGCDMATGAELDSFTDAAQVSDWALDAMQWACGRKLIQGDTGRLMPTGSATRCQVAALLMRFIRSTLK